MLSRSLTLSPLTSSDRDVAVSESNKSPRDAWLDAMSKGDRILSALGSKLRRCRAVFNRLCTSPFIVDFLEPYPLHITGAADYYRVIKAPMWLRLVHSRLVEGTYDNEFDFAWDVRLVFANCCEYNAPQSELYIAAQQLTAEFEILLCDWVHNIRDVSVDDLAVGPWDDWAYLKYFDAADFKENFCRLTGTRTIEVRGSIHSNIAVPCPACNALCYSASFLSILSAAECRSKGLLHPSFFLAFTLFHYIAF